MSSGRAYGAAGAGPVVVVDSGRVTVPPGCVPRPTPPAAAVAAFWSLGSFARAIVGARDADLGLGPEGAELALGDLGDALGALGRELRLQQGDVGRRPGPSCRPARPSPPAPAWRGPGRRPSCRPGSGCSGRTRSPCGRRPGCRSGPGPGRRSGSTRPRPSRTRAFAFGVAFVAVSGINDEPVAKRSEAIEPQASASCGSRADLGGQLVEAVLVLVAERRRVGRVVVAAEEARPVGADAEEDRAADEDDGEDHVDGLDGALAARGPQVEEHGPRIEGGERSAATPSRGQRAGGPARRRRRTDRRRRARPRGTASRRRRGPGSRRRKVRRTRGSRSARVAEELRVGLLAVEPVVVLVGEDRRIVVLDRVALLVVLVVLVLCPHPSSRHSARRPPTPRRAPASRGSRRRRR